MSLWSEIFLGVIAAATFAMAVVQVAVIVAAGRLARRVDRLADHVEQELKPLFSHLNAIGRDASRATALAATQVERTDRLFADVAQRIEQILISVQATVVAPVRESRALMTGIRAAWEALRELRARRARQRAEDEDALFI